MSGGRRRAGYRERYAERARRRTESAGRPLTAWAIDARMTVLEKTIVGRARQVAIVKGLKRNLERGWLSRMCKWIGIYGRALPSRYGPCWP